MGHSIVKYNWKGKIAWGLQLEGKIAALKQQPLSLRDLIEHKEQYLGVDNLEADLVNVPEEAFLAPVDSPLRIICQGVNYASHRTESGLKAASRGNVMFSKDESALTGAYSPVMRPKSCECLDYEVELGLLIKKDITQPVKITEADLPEYIAGLALANDMSPRDLQYRDDYAQWFKAKSCRTMLPLGPLLYLLEKEDFKYLYDLELQLWVNDQIRQQANTSEMIFKPAETITEISEYINLNVGDLILTGTPGGVVVKAPSKFMQGIAAWLLSNEKKVEFLRKNKDKYLQDGDIIKAHIRSKNGNIDLGTQSNKIIPYGF